MVFCFGNLNPNRLATIFSETAIFQHTLGMAIEDELDEEGKKSDGSFPASTFAKAIKEETIEETKKISKKKLELSRELEDLANIGAHFRDITIKIVKTKN